MTPTLVDEAKRSFTGIGFGIQGVPIDILPIYLLNSFLDNFSILIVDEFLRLNGTDEASLNYGQSKLIQTLDNLDQLYGFNTNTILCSSFMNLRSYKDLFKNLKTRIQRERLTDLVLNTVPENKRHLETARDYPIHEFACVQHLIEQGFSLKIGPSKEREYDIIMASLGFDISFSYVLDAFALGTKTADKVIHYIPQSRGPNNGQRIFFDDSEYAVREKLLQGCDTALRYFCKISLISGHILGRTSLDESQLKSLTKKKLKKQTIRLVLDNIVRPYREVFKDD